MFSILSWNIRQGGGSRVLKICSLLAEFAAEVVVLSEFRNNDSGQHIRTQLLKAGYRYQYVTAAKVSENSAAIFSKLPGDATLFPQSDSTYPHNILCVEYEAFRVFGMYLPHKKKHQLFDFLVTQSEHAKPAIMAGDFNSGKNYVDQKGNSFWYEDKLLELETKAYHDAFRMLHGSKKEYSWYSHQGNGYRYDHTYVHESLAPIIRECYYLHKWREDKISDHSPMVLGLG